jgi:predicted MFS family arabinose efflux permease
MSLLSQISGWWSARLVMAYSAAIAVLAAEIWPPADLPQEGHGATEEVRRGREKQERNDESVCRW